MMCLNRWGKIFRTLLVRGGGEEEAVPAAGHIQKTVAVTVTCERKASIATIVV